MGIASADLTTKRDFEDLKLAVKRDLAELEIRLQSKMDKQQAELKLWFIGTALAIGGFMIAAVRFFAP